MFLISCGIIKFRKKNESTFDFTIQTYLKSDLAQKYKHKVTHYPEYYVPKVEDWKLVIDYLNQEKIKPGKINSLEMTLKKQTRLGVPYVISCNIHDRKSKEIFNLLGNVSELVDAEGITFGGSYEDKLSEILKLDFKESPIPGRTVGFRNFCKWVKIDYDPIKNVNSK